jgi:hypothetical protein
MPSIEQQAKKMISLYALSLILKSEGMHRITDTYGL